MGILGDIPKSYKTMEALCDFSEILEKAIKRACKNCGFDFGGGQHVLEYWDKKADENICYGTFFPDGAGETELRFWVGLQWDKKAKPDTCNIVFNVYVPVNLLFLSSRITALLEEAKEHPNYALHRGKKHTLVLKERNISDNELEKTLTKFIEDALGIISELK